jgi:hypothetical protein
MSVYIYSLLKIKILEINVFLVIVSTVSVSAMVSSVNIGNQTGPPCSTYTTIDDPTRNIAQTGLLMCDDGPIFNTSSGGASIRFEGSGGTMIPTSSPGKNHCGSLATGWFNGTLPTLFGTMVNGSACFTADGFDCSLSHEISIVYYTGGFYVNFLPHVPLCSARYCTI